MIDQTGSTLSCPFRIDNRASLATIRTREEITREAIIDILETQPGDRVMLPEYGVRDYAFATVSAGFARRLSFILRQQILDYVQEVEQIEVVVEVKEANQLEVFISYTLRGGASNSFTYPLWRLRQPI